MSEPKSEGKDGAESKALLLQLSIGESLPHHDLSIKPIEGLGNFVCYTGEGHDRHQREFQDVEGRWKRIK